MRDRNEYKPSTLNHPGKQAPLALVGKAGVILKISSCAILLGIFNVIAEEKTNDAKYYLGMNPNSINLREYFSKKYKRFPNPTNPAGSLRKTGDYINGEIIATSKIQYPYLFGNEELTVYKVRDLKTGEIRMASTDDRISTIENKKLLDERDFNERKKMFGACALDFIELLRNKSEQDILPVEIVIKSIPVELVDKSKSSSLGAATLKSKPVKEVNYFLDKYSIIPDNKLLKHGSLSFTCKIPIKKIMQIMHDKDIAIIGFYNEREPVPLSTVVDYQWIADGAHNPSPIPADSRGQGVNIATIEAQRIWPSFTTVQNVLNFLPKIWDKKSSS